MEDYVPLLREFSEKLVKMDEDTIDAQEMDYIYEINIYTRYLMLYVEGVNVKRPELLFLGRDRINRYSK